MAELAVTFPRKGVDYIPLPRSSDKEHVTVHAVQTIAAQPEHIFDLYIRAEAIPIWQEGVISVSRTEDGHFHWIVEEPTSGAQTEFNSEIVSSVPGERHVSRVLDGPFAGSTDSLTFELHAHGRGTIVTWVSEFKLPAANVSNIVGKIASRGPHQAVVENLRRLKQVIESGEIPSVEGQPSGPRGVIGRWKRFLMGENLPVPPGTSDRARPRDLPQQNSESQAPWVVVGIGIAAGVAAWYGVRSIRSL
ncbi:SRPBCC family protein [Terriglobus roseus]|uniref:Polyketide cyclase / dehydrase and lipid transport n=1 Tax=Terriglobus roseus TaxID=392734 RepID=A0A1G7HDR5_9BACT|nr:SRPBCC family protein [Terriglobus roseus]SDE98511.1 Polyketide cyclase / dehydrase and lipid transport [Terriglobus roseus]